jgi:hypothetical protein
MPVHSDFYPIADGDNGLFLVHGGEDSSQYFFVHAGTLPPDWDSLTAAFQLSFTNNSLSGVPCRDAHYKNLIMVLYVDEMRCR